MSVEKCIVEYAQTEGDTIENSIMDHVFSTMALESNHFIPQHTNKTSDYYGGINDYREYVNDLKYKLYMWWVKLPSGLKDAVAYLSIKSIVSFLIDNNEVKANVNVNDIFTPSGDYEIVLQKDLIHIYHMHRLAGSFGVFRYVAFKRNTMPMHSIRFLSRYILADQFWQTYYKENKEKINENVDGESKNTM